MLAPMMLFFAATGRCDGIEDRMNGLVKSSRPVEIVADTIVHDIHRNSYTAEGNVKISQNGVELTAQKVTLNAETGEAVAEGGVVLSDEANVLMADRIEVDFDTRLGIVYGGELFVSKENYHITGESVKKETENLYRVKSGSMTTCDAKRPFWRVTADDLSVRMDKDVRATGVVMRIKEIPVLYTPYAWFPLLKPRTTGFLIPKIGYSTEDGMRLFNSFYWAPVDNFDATFSVDYRSRRGAGLGLELRAALAPGSETNFYGYFMDDRKDLRERYNFSLMHRHDISDRTSVKVDVGLSDRQFFRDLAESAFDRTRRSMDSNVFVTRAGDHYLTYLFGQYTRGLYLNDDYIVQRLPELGISLTKRRLWDSPVYLDTDASAAYFNKSKGVTGGRVDVSPTLSATFDLAGLYLTPSIGYRETVYELSGKEKTLYDEERGLFGAGVSLQTALSRSYDFGEGPGLSSIRHTIEPLVSYNYVDERGGGSYVKFDEIDTYGRKSSVAYSLTNRFVLAFEGENGSRSNHYVTLRLGQFYDYYKDTVVLGVKRNFSSLYGELIYDAGRLLTLKSDIRYNLYSGELLSANTDLRFTWLSNTLRLILGHRYSKDTDQTFLSPSSFGFFTPTTDFDSKFVIYSFDEDEKVNFLSAEGGVKLWDSWDLSARLWYDTRTDNFREIMFQVGYSSQCWGISTKFVNSPGERRFMVLLNLKGIGVVKM